MGINSKISPILKVFSEVLHAESSTTIKEEAEKITLLGPTS